MHELGLLTLAGLLAGGPAEAAGIRATEVWPFDSGFQVMLERDDRFPSTRIALAVGAGVIDTPVGARQTAHLVEHLVFHRKADGSDEDLATTLERLGCEANASTWPDVTVYEVRCAEAQAPEALRALLPVLVDPLAGVTAEDLALEQTLVQQEAALNATGTRPMLEGLRRVAFPDDHGYGLAGDDITHVPDIDLDDARAFVAAHYRPEDAILALGGRVDHDALLDALVTALPPAAFHPGLAEDALRSWDPDAMRVFETQAEARWFADPRRPEQPLTFGVTPPPAAQGPIPPPLPVVEGIHRVRASVRQPLLSAVWTLPGPKRTSYWLMRDIGDFATYDVRHALKRTPGAEDPWCETEVLEQATLLACHVPVAPGANPRKIQRAVVKAFQRSIEGFRALELQEFATGIRERSGQFFELDDGGLETLRAIVMHHRSVGASTYYLDRYARVGSADVAAYARLAARWITEERVRWVHTEPSPGAVLDVGAPTGVARVDPPSVAGRPPIRPVLRAVEAMEVRTLEDGLTVVHVPLDGLPFLRTDLVTRVDPRDGPTLREQQDRWVRGRIDEETPDDVHRAVLSARPHASWGDLSMTQHWTADSPLDAVFRTLSEWLRTVHWDAPSPKAKAAWADRVIASWRDPFAWFEDDWSTQTGGAGVLHDPSADPGASGGAGTEVAASRWAPEHTVLVVTGKTGAAEAFWEAAREALGTDWNPARASVAPAPPLPVPATPAASTWVYPAPERALTLAMRCALPTGAERSKVAANHVLAPWVETRAWQALRTSSGVAYAVSTTRVEGGTGPALDVRMTVAPDRAEDAARAMLALVEAMGEAPGEADVAEARWRAATLLDRDVDSLRAVSDLIRTQIRQGRPLADLPRLPADIAAVTPEDLGERLHACLARKVYAVLGDAHTGFAAQHVLGLPPANLDWRGRWLGRVQAFAPGRYPEEARLSR